MSDEDPLPIPPPVENNPNPVEAEQSAPPSYEEIADQEILRLNQQEIEIREKIIARLKEILADSASSASLKEKAEARLASEEQALQALKGGRSRKRTKRTKKSIKRNRNRGRRMTNRLRR